MSRKVNLSKEDVEKYYIEEFHTVQECIEHFGIAKTTFNRYLKKYGIVRSKEDKSKVYSRAQNSEEVKKKVREANIKKYGAVSKVAASSPIRFVSESTFTVHGKEYSVDWLREKYLDQNVSAPAISEVLGITYAVFRKIASHYHVLKNSSQRYEIIEHNITEKYGVVSTFQLHDVKEKSAQTCLERYGEKNPMSSGAIQIKVKNTMLKKYGVENYTQTEEYREKIRQTNLNKYGVLNHMQQGMKHTDIWNDKSKMEHYLSSLGKKVTPYDLMLFFNLSDRTAVYEKIHKWGFDSMIDFNPARSHYEDEIISFLNSLGIENILENDRSVLNGKEIDIYIPDYNIGIEFNGDYWHSDAREEYQDHNGRSLSHQKKSLLAESKGVFLFHIFEREWTDNDIRAKIQERIRTLLGKNTIRIPARKCKLVVLDKTSKREFLERNHIQGNDKSSVFYGLEYLGELVGCMTFVHPKNGKYTWELSRCCSKNGCVVQGGASKMFAHFVKTLIPGNTISSYSDITKTKGNLYKKLGFDMTSINPPNYVWINFSTKDVRTRYQEQSAGEVERMHSLGYHRVCDCGTKTWVYTVK